MNDHTKSASHETSQAAQAHTLGDFNYDLPPELIAQHPAEQRTNSRLLHVQADGNLQDRHFTDLLGLLKPHDLLVFNDTLVIKARLHGSKQTGGKVEVLIERILDQRRALAHVKASKTPKPGSQLLFGDAFEASVVAREHDLFELAFNEDILTVLDKHGHVPLPPYITHSDSVEDAARYQTVYARHPGAVAAPTAGLHFDQATLDALETHGIGKAFVTLHVGAGTFQPVRDNDLANHVMHREWYTVPQQTVDAVNQAKAAGGRIIAVGTTSVRALESACLANAGKLETHQDDTQLFIKPGYRWQIVDALVTNFHLPQSTLLMLVASLIGFSTMKSAYAHAVEQRYRFFSYGDAMFLEKKATV